MDILTQIENEKKIKSSIFGGRVGRLDFLVYEIIIFMILYLGVVLLLFNKYFEKLHVKLDEFIYLFSLILIFASIFYGLIVLPAKRLHDFDLSGNYVVFLFVPGINLIFLLYIALIKGNMEDNSYGKKHILVYEKPLSEKYGKTLIIGLILISLIILIPKMIKII